MALELVPGRRATILIAVGLLLTALATVGLFWTGAELHYRNCLTEQQLTAQTISIRQFTGSAALDGTEIDTHSTAKPSSCSRTPW